MWKIFLIPHNITVPFIPAPNHFLRIQEFPDFLWTSSEMKLNMIVFHSVWLELRLTPNMIVISYQIPFVPKPELIFRWKIFCRGCMDFKWNSPLHVNMNLDVLSNMCGDQAEWVVCREYWFWDTSIIVWNSLCILLFSAEQNWVYLWNRKSNFDEVFSKTNLSDYFTK